VRGQLPRSTSAKGWGRVWVPRFHR
jgi:hypothetical protein